MSIEDNKATTRRFFEEVFNRGNLTVVDEVKSSNYVFHDPGLPEPIRGPEGFKQYIMLFRNAFPISIAPLRISSRRERKLQFASHIQVPSRATSWAFHQRASR